MLNNNANGCPGEAMVKLRIPERDDWAAQGNPGLDAEGNPKWLGTTDSTDLLMKANNQPMLRVGADGNVDVLGQLRVPGMAATEGSVYKLGINEWGEVAPLNPCLLFTDNGFEPVVSNPDWSSTTNKIFVDYDCPVNVGIGTANPMHRLQVNGNSSFLGSVGIGLSPSNGIKLHVNGRIKGESLEINSSAALGRTVVNTDDSPSYEATGLTVRGVTQGKILHCLGDSDFPAMTVFNGGQIGINGHYSNNEMLGTFNIRNMENSSVLYLKSTTYNDDVAITVLNSPNQRAYVMRRLMNGNTHEQYALFGNGDVLQHGTLMMGLENGQWPSTGAAKIVANTSTEEQSGLWVNTWHSGSQGGIVSNMQGNHPNTRALTVNWNGATTWQVLADGTTHVCGMVHCKKLKVESGWCDFVFEKNYPLPSLYDTERRISELGHLPGLPSQKDVEEHGLDVSEAMKGQMLHMEEMYLHLFQIRKELDALKRENAELKALITK